MTTSKIIIYRNSQKVRIPKKFRFSTNKVKIRRYGEGIFIEPAESSFERLMNIIDDFSKDFMKEGRDTQI